MGDDGPTFAELLAWIAEETPRWQAWFARQPEAVWGLAFGSGRTATVRDLVFHVFAVDLRYGQRLLGLPVTPFEEIPAADPEALFALAARGQEQFRRWLAESTPGDRAQVIEFQTLSAGLRRASKRTVLAHSLTHHLRHMAQLATVLRQHGHPTDWPHDLLMSRAMA